MVSGQCSYFNTACLQNKSKKVGFLPLSYQEDENSNIRLIDF